MKRHLGLSGIGLGALSSCVAVTLISTAASAQSVAIISDVSIRQTEGGIEVILASDNGSRPQIFTVSRDNTLVADLINTELRLADGGDFTVNNPASDIASVTVSQLDANSVRVVVAGEASLPVGQVRQTDEAIVFDFATATATDIESVPVAVEPVQPSAPLPEPDIVAQDPDLELEPVDPNDDDIDVLVPDPEVRIDGVDVAPAPIVSAPPVLPRAIAPPVGDIAVTSIDPSPATISLGTSEVLPRLVLRDAPVREVLSLLARAAGLNLAFTGDPEADIDQEDITISLDIENEPIQDVFNYVLRLSGLDASRFGRTIFAGPRLPNGARQLVVRNLRLNQVDVPTALNFLVGLGAETAVSRQRLVTAVNAVAIGDNIEPLTQTQTFEQEQIETERIEYQDSTPLLRGLQVVGDERTNSVTLIGTPRQIEIAVAQLIPLDIRRRQVAVNVKVIDVDLNAIDRASSSFSFGAGNNSVIQEGGVGVVNFGDQAPAGLPGDILTNNFGNVTGAFTPFDFEFNGDFLGQLQLAITNSNAKILTDPTLVVQEGQQAEVVLADEVITNVEIETDGTGDDQTQTVTVVTEPAGVILRVQIDRIDDNGFVNLSVAPTVSEPSSTETVTVEGASIDLTLLSERRLSSGQLRLRDGQTIVLSGIIQDTDQVDSTKIPILGDLPIIGALFRRTERTNERSEVIIVMTVNVLDDSEGSTFGYSYTPGSADSQELLQR
ncbi:MAG: AMIN domain-containing protein [Elainellaceae cyanobacterium]